MHILPIISVLREGSQLPDAGPGGGGAPPDRGPHRTPPVPSVPQLRSLRRRLRTSARDPSAQPIPFGQQTPSDINQRPPGTSNQEPIKWNDCPPKKRILLYDQHFFVGLLVVHSLSPTGAHPLHRRPPMGRSAAVAPAAPPGGGGGCRPGPPLTPPLPFSLPGADRSRSAQRGPVAWDRRCLLPTPPFPLLSGPTTAAICWLLYSVDTVCRGATPPSRPPPVPRRRHNYTAPVPRVTPQCAQCVSFFFAQVAGSGLPMEFSDGHTR